MTDVLEPIVDGPGGSSSHTAQPAVRLSVEERRRLGKQAREAVPLESHLGWEPAPERADPVSLLEEQDAAREADLVPVRHGRMVASPFTFYRGGAKIMAADLDGTPTSGQIVQLCGDAHLSNFGVFASPERNLVFDLNDFDETLPGPFEYDVKRLAASFSVAARNNGFTESESRAITLACAASYRQAMAEFAAMGVLETWYARLSAEDLVKEVRATAGSKKDRKRPMGSVQKQLDKARSKNSLQALSKLCEVVDGQYRIVSQPPIIIPARELAGTYGSGEEVVRRIDHQLNAYRDALQDDRRLLLERYELVDVARKVVGVGSVGARAFIGLLQGRDEHDPLFLQVKEATSSVLEDRLPKSRYANHGQRVVEGQRMMQASSDIFLGWTQGVDVERHYYWRQLRDMKGSAEIESMLPAGMTIYAMACGWTLARAHARSGDPVAITGYLGKSARFDESIADFSERYADQNQVDFEAFAGAIRSGRLEAQLGI